MSDGTAGPGAGRGAGPAGMAGVDGRILERVRALLAKAESTTFPAEAEALSGKAQQLMSRYAIDQAMVGAPGRRRGGGGEPGRMTLTTDPPYASSKAQLLSRVAAANRCQAVWSRQLNEAVVFGFPADLEATELLYTSLLVQAGAAMAHAGRSDRRARSRGFRHAFLLAYAVRIGERLHRAAHEVTAAADAEHGGSLLPVLAARGREVEAAVAEAFPRLGRMRTSASDGAGWVAGRAAADRASLHGPSVGAGRGRALGGGPAA